MIYSLLFVLSSLLAYGNEFRVITLEYNPGVGMFAAANQVLGQLYMFENGQISGMTVDFGNNGLYYDQNCGLNWWSYYFEPICVGERINETYPNQENYFEAWSQRRSISRQTAARVIANHIHVKPHIQRKVDSFVKRYFNQYIIGVHYRGTDKGKEAPRVSYETVFEEIDKHIPPDNMYSLFVATDEIEFLEQARTRYSERVVATEAVRSDSHVGVHFVNKNNYTIGEEALIDACLLSRCSVLIRTSSNLSLWSTYFNPELPVVLLNHRYMDTLEPE